jgi:hypothetical protein
MTAPVNLSNYLAASRPDLTPETELTQDLIYDLSRAFNWCDRGTMAAFDLYEGVKGKPARTLQDLWSNYSSCYTDLLYLLYCVNHPDYDTIRDRVSDAAHEAERAAARDQTDMDRWGRSEVAMAIGTAAGCDEVRRRVPVVPVVMFPPRRLPLRSDGE